MVNSTSSNLHMPSFIGRGLKRVNTTKQIPLKLNRLIYKNKQNQIFNTFIHVPSIFKKESPLHQYNAIAAFFSPSAHFFSKDRSNIIKHLGFTLMLEYAN